MKNHYHLATHDLLTSCEGLISTGNPFGHTLGATTPKKNEHSIISQLKDEVVNVLGVKWYHN